MIPPPLRGYGDGRMNWKQSYAPKPINFVSPTCCGYFAEMAIDGRNITAKCRKCGLSNNYPLPEGYAAIIDFDTRGVAFGPDADRLDSWATEKNDYAGVVIQAVK